MDLLHKRYASPFSFMDGYIATGRFNEFVSSFIDTVNQEKEEKHNWEFFLHKVFDKSYGEFIDSIKINNETQNMSVRTIETTVEDSMNILKNFKPKEGGE